MASGESDLVSIQRLLEESDRVDEQRRLSPYDGVLGALPEWVPEWHRNNFCRIRNRLLDNGLYGEKLSPEQILAWMDDYCELGDVPGGDYARTGFIPKEIFDEIGSLAHIRYAVSLGRAQGLVFLAGKGALTGSKTLAAVRKAQTALYGTADEKKQRWDRYQAEVERLYKDHSCWSWAQIKRYTAKNMSCSVKTIERYCRNPKKS